MLQFVNKGLSRSQERAVQAEFLGHDANLLDGAAALQ